MRKPDIKAGLVYAMVDRKEGRPYPVVFLEAPRSARLWSHTRGSAEFRFQLSRSSHAHAGHGFSTYGPGAGYAVVAHRRSMVLTNGALKVLESLPVAKLAEGFGALKATAYSGNPDGALEYTIVTSLAKVIGLYDEVIADYVAQQNARNAHLAQQQAARREYASRADAARAILAGYGITADYYAGVGAEGGSIKISLSDAEKLGALLSA